jgi:hypothetical protein
MGRDAERGFRSRLSSAVGTLCVLAVVGFGVYGIAVGAYQLWFQHSGVPAQVKITHCKRNYGRGGWTPRNCAAQWRQSDGTERTVTVHGPKIYYGQIVDVHLRGDEGYVDGPWPWRILVVGILVVAIVGGLFLFRRKNRAPPEEYYWP